MIEDVTGQTVTATRQVEIKTGDIGHVMKKLKVLVGIDQIGPVIMTEETSHITPGHAKEPRTVRGTNEVMQSAPNLSRQSAPRNRSGKRGYARVTSTRLLPPSVIGLQLIKVVMMKMNQLTRRLAVVVGKDVCLIIVGR